MYIVVLDCVESDQSAVFAVQTSDQANQLQKELVSSLEETNAPEMYEVKQFYQDGSLTFDPHTIAEKMLSQLRDNL